MRMLAVAAVILAALVAAAGTAVSLNPDQEQVLTAIDSVPTKVLYDSLQLSSPLDLSTLQGVATDNTESPSFPAFRMRAIHALATYCAVTPCPDNDPAHQTLVGLVIAYGSAQGGSELLILRGAIEALGLMKDPNDEAMIAGLLNHPSRDIRSTAALALGALCNTAAQTPLHQRLTNESSDQVKLAISAALRILASCVP